VTATERYIDTLRRLKEGELGLLRTHAWQGLDESVQGFDLFTGLWWPLREKNQFAPRRKVSWLISKIYAACPLEYVSGATLARQLRRCQPSADKERGRFRKRFDHMLMASLNQIEPSLRWALNTLAKKDLPVDWVKLTDDLSMWERESTRLTWAKEILEGNE